MPRSTLPVEITHVNPMTNEATMSPLSSQLVVVLRHASLVSNARFIPVHVSFCRADCVPRPSATPEGCASQESSHSNLRLAVVAVPISRLGTVASPDGPSCSGGGPHRPRQGALCSQKRRENSRPLSVLLGIRDLRSQDCADESEYYRRHYEGDPDDHDNRDRRTLTLYGPAPLIGLVGMIVQCRSIRRTRRATDGVEGSRRIWR